MLLLLLLQTWPLEICVMGHDLRADPSFTVSLRRVNCPLRSLYAIEFSSFLIATTSQRRYCFSSDSLLAPMLTLTKQPTTVSSKKGSSTHCSS